MHPSNVLILEVVWPVLSHITFDVLDDGIVYIMSTYTIPWPLDAGTSRKVIYI